MISTKKESLRPRSKKRAKQEREYAKIRAIFLDDYPTCQVLYCETWATEVHHKKGRTGGLLTDVRYFMAVCRDHHQRIEEHPEWAKEHGYSISRLAKI
jgi:hypothetical protein